MNRLLGFVGLLLALGVPTVAERAPDRWVDAARAVPVAAEGRVLPLETWAQVVYDRTSGKTRDPEALRWLLTLLSRPQDLDDQPTFLVNNPEALAGLGTGITERGRYSPRQLAAAFAAADQWATLPQVEPSPLDRERRRLASALVTYQALAATFASVDARSLSSPLRCLTLETTPRNPTEVLEAREAGVALPAGEGSRLALLLYWKSESAAGHWDEASQALALVADHRLDLEVWYNHVPWLVMVLVLGALSVVLGQRRQGLPRRIQALPVVASAVVVTAWIALRVVLSGRPPVTDLGGSFLFVGWLAWVWSSVAALRPTPSPLGRIPALAGMALVALATALEGGSDPFSPLPAVLNTNFWLTLHVTTIVAGYAATLMVGLAGHLYLAMAGSKKPGGNLLPLWTTMNQALVAALVLTVTGTLLGGVWADQSWGRFWGWDPKENGALMVILWLALTLHLKPSGWTSEWGTAVAAALALPVLLVSWLGVNLLAGLHSYAWAPGRALAFSGLLAADALALATLILRRVLR